MSAHNRNWLRLVPSVTRTYESKPGHSDTLLVAGVRTVSSAGVIRDGNMFYRNPFSKK